MTHRLGRPSRRLGALTVGLLALLGATHREARAAAPPASSLMHEVKRGDTLSSIARRYGVSVPVLVAANRLPRDRPPLKVGRKLTIPVRATNLPPTKVTTAAAAMNSMPVRVVAAKSGLHVRLRVARPERRTRVHPPGDGLVRLPPPSLVLAVPEFVLSAPPFAWPVDGGVSSAFGRRRRAWHRGIDIQADQGAPVMAAAPGLVVASGVEPRYGRVVKVLHDGGFLTVYAHNTVNAVAIGDWVTAGQIIAVVGMTGRATSPHLHFEIRREGRVFNPLYLLPLPPRVATTTEEVMESDEDEDE